MYATPICSRIMLAQACCSSRAKPASPAPHARRLNALHLYAWNQIGASEFVSCSHRAGPDLTFTAPQEVGTVFSAPHALTPSSLRGVAFAAGWLVGTALRPWQWLGGDPLAAFGAEEAAKNVWWGAGCQPIARQPGAFPGLLRERLHSPSCRWPDHRRPLVDRTRVAAPTVERAEATPGRITFHSPRQCWLNRTNVEAVRKVVGSFIRHV